ncbi:GNAT family N-acetyltransferase [Demequina aurantiaca]|uniref:GNAT family N-acetyltransferase n=1 Tax=Demequina aurantiaca TaxID=676200 RepID=UPI000783A812|nr:GNAT family N-acetyltransferase [Demequina aurantiaca]
MLSIRRVQSDDAAARGLWDEQQAEMRVVYGDDGHVDAPEGEAFDDAIDLSRVYASLVGADESGEDIATAMLQWPAYDLPLGTIEAKRLYVRPEHRRRGYSRVMMGALEAAARRSGATSIALETGTEQPAAIALYEALGYHRIEPYGQYNEDPRSVCFAKELPTRVLVVNGSIGAGKTTSAAAVFDALEARGSRSAFIDGDFLCQAVPPPADDPYNQALFFQNLAATAPVYRARGCGLVVISRVLEDADDRARCATAFASVAGQADVSIVRVDAPLDVREARLSVREPEGKWRDWALARTVELSDSLDSQDLDDAIVMTAMDAGENRSRAEVAEDVLDAAGWA